MQDVRFMTKVKKVLIINPDFHIDGGAERVIVRLANYLTDKNIEVCILTCGMIPEIKCQIKEARLIISKDFAEMSRDFQIICKDFDAINIHNTPCELLPYSRKLNTIWMCNEPPKFNGETCDISDSEKSIVKKFIKKVVVADEFNQKRFKEIYDMDSEINNYGIDYDFFNKGEPKNIIDKYHLQNNFVITQVAFIHQTKNQLRTINIFREIKSKIPNAKLILAGLETKYKELVEKRIIMRGLKDDVIFTGHLPRNEIRDLYHASDIIMQPCKAQGSWLSVFEAMSAGKPVIISKEMTASSILEKEDIGFVEGFVKHTLEIKKGKLKDNSEWVKNNLSWKKYCDKMLEVFEK